MTRAKTSASKEPASLTVKNSGEVLHAAFGPGDAIVLANRMTEVLQLLWLPEGIGLEVKQAKLDELILTLADIAPRDALERMLAVQMVACHHAAVECFRRAMLAGQSFEGRGQSLKHAEKLTATYAKLLETLNKHRGKGQQKITIEHVNVEPGGQAIVGHVETGGRSGVSPVAQQVPLIEQSTELPNLIGRRAPTPVAKKR